MTELLNVLPNLSIGVVSIGGLIYVTLKFLATLDIRADRHEKAMKEREDAMRALEFDVRKSLSLQLMENTNAMHNNTMVLERIVRRLDGNKE